MSVESNMMPLGTVAPDFELPDTVSGKMLSLNDVRGDKGMMVMFICNHCPYVKHVDDEIIRIARDYEGKGVGIVAISSNAVETHPEDGPEAMKVEAERLGYSFPYLYDQSQAVARAYDAACTPDFYLFDEDLKCVYRGRLDGSTPKNDVPLTGEEFRKALDALLTGQPVDPNQKPSMGCNIKWRE